MPDLVTSVEHLADLELYHTEKPYHVLLSAENLIDSIPTNNLEFEYHDDILITDIRGRQKDFSLDVCGFTVLDHTTAVEDFVTLDGLQAYQRETEAYLTKWFNADRVVTWDVKLRTSVNEFRQTLNLRDWTVPDGPARGAHNDITEDSAITIMEDHLPKDVKEKYGKDGYRFRMVNTWRILLPVAEDNPLVVCDFRTIDPNDLIACDRVIPTRAGEVYYLKYNSEQRWHWLEHMTPKEPFLFVLYDSVKGEHACYCAHVPVTNTRAPPSAPKRRSVETRSIIITKIPDDIEYKNTH